MQDFRSSWQLFTRITAVIEESIILELVFWKSILRLYGL